MHDAVHVDPRQVYVVWRDLARGDDALADYSRRFDQLDFTQVSMRVEAHELASTTARPTLVLYGRIEAPDRIRAAAPISGRIIEVKVRDGDRVEAGTVIARLDAAGAQLSVDRARLVLEDAQRTVDRLAQLAQSGTATALQRLMVTVDSRIEGSICVRDTGIRTGD